NVDGYNLSYVRPGATVGVLTDDEYHAPVLAFWHHGLGLIGAVTARVRAPPCDATPATAFFAWNWIRIESVAVPRTFVPHRLRSLRPVIPPSHSNASRCRGSAKTRWRPVS